MFTPVARPLLRPPFSLPYTAGIGGASTPASVIAAKSAAASAPAAGSLQYQAQTVTYLGANGFPDLSFERHYISGAGIGTADFFTKTKAYYNPTSWASMGGPTNGENDGSNAAFWQVNSNMGTVQVWNPAYYAFTTNSRYLWIPSQAGQNAQVRVSDKLLPANAPIAWPTNNNMAKIDLGTVATRNIVVQTNSNVPVAELSITAGATLTPYDWHAGTGRVPTSFMADSYGQGSDYSLVGLPFLQYIAELCGFGALTQSTIGGTGYSNSNGVGFPNAQDTFRISAVTRENPTVHVCQLGINDPGGATFTTACAAYWAAVRTALPTALLVAQTSWAPNQTNGANPGGVYQDRRTRLYSVMAGVSGPWIIIDNLAGTWLTSKGTSSGAGTGPWQTGDGFVGNTTGIGNGDTWVSADGTHPTALGYKGLAELFATAYKAAVASM